MNNKKKNTQKNYFYRYFWYHHSVADTMDVLDPDDLDKATAVWAVVSYIIADLTDDFPRSRDTNWNDDYLGLNMFYSFTNYYIVE